MNEWTVVPITIAVFILGLIATGAVLYFTSPNRQDDNHQVEGSASDLGSRTSLDDQIDGSK
jgi:hypothetical protein